MEAITETYKKRKRGRPMGSEDSAPRSMSKSEFAARLERLRAAGVIQGTSAAVLYAVVSSEYWLKILEELEKLEDWRTITEVMKFHQQMHEGRPAQRITVTSVGVTFTADELARTRGVARELATKAIEQVSAIATPPSPDDRGESTIAPPLLLRDKSE